MPIKKRFGYFGSSLLDSTFGSERVHFLFNMVFIVGDATQTGEGPSRYLKSSPISSYRVRIGGTVHLMLSESSTRGGRRRRHQHINLVVRCCPILELV